MCSRKINLQSKEGETLEQRIHKTVSYSIVFLESRNRFRYVFYSFKLYWWDSVTALALVDLNI